MRPLFETPTFKRSLKRLTKRNKVLLESVLATLRLLSEDAFCPALKTHKLRGDMQGIYACSAGYDLRVTFVFAILVEVDHVVLLDIGSHDDVY